MLSKSEKFKRKKKTNDIVDKRVTLTKVNKRLKIVLNVLPIIIDLFRIFGAKENKTNSDIKIYYRSRDKTRFYYLR